MSDANSELIKTLEYMDFLLPKEFDELLVALEKERKSPRQTNPSPGRQTVLHVIGNMTVLCMAGQVIPHDHLPTYKAVLRRFSHFIERLRALHFEFSPIILDELQRNLPGIRVPGRISERGITTDQ